MLSVLICTLLIIGAQSITTSDTGTTATPASLYLTSCMQDKYQAANGGTGTLGCTAQDVKITSLIPHNDNVGSTCFSGEHFTFKAIASFQVGATNRYDASVFFSYSNTNALTGTCGATYMKLNWTSDQASGISNKEATKGNDICGDVGSAENVIVLLSIETLCLNSNSNTSYADISYCTTWHQNAGGDCYDLNDLYPSASSKCFCGSYNDLFKICQRCTITPNGNKSVPCNGGVNSGVVQSGDFTFSAGCQTSTISYTDTAFGTCVTKRVATAQDSCGTTVTSAPQYVSNDCAGSCYLPTTNHGMTYDCEDSRTASNSDVNTTGCSNVQHSDASFSLPCGVYTRTWTAQDVCGSSYTYLQQINVTDFYPPVIVCPSNTTVLNCGFPTGIEDGSVSSIISVNGDAHNYVSVVYTAEDQCNNHVHTVCTFLCANVTL